jgi:hypothetical protein
MRHRARCDEACESLFVRENFRPRCESIGAADGQDVRMPRMQGCVGATDGQEAQIRQMPGSAWLALMGDCVGLKIGLTPARVAGQ